MLNAFFILFLVSVASSAPILTRFEILSQNNYMTDFPSVSAFSNEIPLYDITFKACCSSTMCTSEYYPEMNAVKNNTACCYLKGTSVSTPVVPGYKCKEDLSSFYICGHNNTAECINCRSSTYRFKMQRFDAQVCQEVEMPMRYFELTNNIVVETVGSSRNPLQASLVSTETQVIIGGVFIKFQHGNLYLEIQNGTISFLSITGSGGAVTYNDLSGVLSRNSLTGPSSDGVVLITFMKESAHYGPIELRNEKYDPCIDANCIFCSTAYVTYNCSKGTTSVMIAFIWICIILTSLIILVLLALLTYKLAKKVISWIPTLKYTKMKTETVTTDAASGDVELKEDPKTILGPDDVSEIEYHYKKPTPYGAVKKKALKEINKGNYTLNNVEGDRPRMTIGDNLDKSITIPTKSFTMKGLKWTLMIIGLLLKGSLACEQHFAISGETETCVSGNGTTTCSIALATTITLPGVGSTSCFQLKTSGGQLAASVSIKVIDYYELFKFGFSYYTTDYIPAQINARDCGSWCRWRAMDTRYGGYIPGGYLLDHVGRAECSDTVYACDWWYNSGSIYGAQWVSRGEGEFHSISDVVESFFQPVYQIDISTQEGQYSYRVDISPNQYITLHGMTFSRGPDSSGHSYNMMRKLLTSSNKAYLCLASTANNPVHSQLGDYQSNLPYVRNSPDDHNLNDIIYPEFTELHAQSDGGNYWYTTFPTGMSFKNSLCKDLTGGYNEAGFALSYQSDMRVAVRSTYSVAMTLNIQSLITYRMSQFHEDSTASSLTATCTGTSGLFGNVEITYKCCPLYTNFVSPISLTRGGVTDDVGFGNCSCEDVVLNVLGTSEVTSLDMSMSNKHIHLECATPFLSLVTNGTFTVTIPEASRTSESFSIMDWFESLPDWASSMLSIILIVIVVALAAFAAFKVITLLCRKNSTK